MSFRDEVKMARNNTNVDNESDEDMDEHLDEVFNEEADEEARNNLRLNNTFTFLVKTEPYA